MICPLCKYINIDEYYQDSKREYLQCQNCSLIFVQAQYQLSAKEEKAQYEFHENDPQDEGYREFLSRLASPLLKKLEPNSLGLDFGCGPGPTLSVMLEEAGHKVKIFDPFFYPNHTYLSEIFDFITATEVLEHVSKPADVVKQLDSMLKPGGYLGIMTKLAENKDKFSRWHYKNDPTHISFYSMTTLNWLAKKLDCKLEKIAADAFLFKKIH